MEGLIVRPAVEADREQLIRLMVELQDYERFIHHSRLPGAEVAEGHFERLVDWVEQSAGALVVAEDQDEVVGYAPGWMAVDNDPLQHPDYRRHGYLADVFVTQRWRAKGIARSLLAGIETHLRQSGAKRLRIGSLARNANAIAAYRDFGFEPFELVLEKDL